MKYMAECSGYSSLNFQLIVIFWDWVTFFEWYKIFDMHVYEVSSFEKYIKLYKFNSKILLRHFKLRVNLCDK